MRVARRGERVGRDDELHAENAALGELWPERPAARDAGLPALLGA